MCSRLPDLQFDSTWPCSSQVLDEMFRDYPASTRAAITRDDVARLYDL